MKPKTIKIFEKVSFPDLGVAEAMAKIDTGAWGGALHATDIAEVTLPTGEQAVSFKPLGLKSKVTVSDFKQLIVRSSNGQESKRYAIPTIITIRGVQYPTRISLVDRSTMKWPVLVGRSFLREHGFLVDAQMYNEYGDEGK